MKKNKQSQPQTIVIQLKNVTKKYNLYHDKPTFVENVFKSGFHEQFTALDKVSLTIHKGESVGIIGSNGAGKTTLLKIIAGIAFPNQGLVRTRGKIVSVINLSAGFQPDLTGEENIFLNGLVLGMSKIEIEKQFKNIIEFANIGQFIDAPLYTYSSGMKLRLGFSVAIHANPDLLLLDEGVLTGDSRFKNKSEKTINKLLLSNATVLMAGHNIRSLKKLCSRLIWFDNGRIIDSGKPEAIARKYLSNFTVNRGVKKSNRTPHSLLQKNY